MLNGKTKFDTNGNVLHAHGGWILQHEGYWYWYGEDRRGNDYVAVYRSTDLTNWEHRGTILSVDTPIDETRFPNRTHKLGSAGNKVNIERPKVIYNEKTGKFILWAHYENGHDYLDAMCCTAVSDSPEGPFTYLGSFNPCGAMSRDCTVFQDEDGKSYFLSAANDNADMHMYLMTDDMLDIEKQVNKLYIGELREAPAVFKKDGKYYMVTSYCTGWAPNQGKWSSSDNMTGEWSELQDFGDKTTFDSQSAFILPVGNRFYYVGDRWMGSGDKYFTSTYIVLEIRFTTEGTPFIEFTDTCDIL